MQRTLAGRYRLEERHGGGGMGSVYSAEDTRLGRKIAVKILQDNLAADPRFVERFRREARAAASLSHPNIAGVFDYGEDGGSRFIVMELVPGRDLAHVLREEGPLEPERATRIAEQIARALGHAHEAGVVHRDIKPGNVLVDDRDHVKVTDFGIARAAGDATLTASGAIMGTVHYISPEQAAGTTTLPASDVYSLGIVLYEMITGSVPFTADSAVGVAMRHLDEEVPAPSRTEPGTPTYLDDIVRTATAKAPEQRFANGHVMAEALAGRTTPAATTPLVAPAGSTETAELGGRWDPMKLGRTVIAVLAGLAAVALALALIRVSQGTQETSSPPVQTPVAEETPTETPTLTGYELPAEIEGGNAKEWKEVFKEVGIEVKEIKVDTEEVPKDTIMDVDPDPGSLVRPGETVTLTISSGEEPKDEDEDGPPGHEKNENKDRGKKEDD